MLNLVDVGHIRVETSVDTRVHLDKLTFEVPPGATEPGYIGHLRVGT